MKHHEIVKSCPSLPKSTYWEPRWSKELTGPEDLYMSYLSYFYRENNSPVLMSRTPASPPPQQCTVSAFKILVMRWLSSCLPNPQAHKATHASLYSPYIPFRWFGQLLCCVYLLSSNYKSTLHLRIANPVSTMQFNNNCDLNKFIFLCCQIGRYFP